jgi:hypothetical protein
MGFEQNKIDPRFFLVCGVKSGFWEYDLIQEAALHSDSGTHIIKSIEIVRINLCKAGRSEFFYQIVDHANGHIPAVSPPLKSDDEDRMIYLGHLLYD